MCVMNKNTLIIGFMLFAFFFGSGNLIFPPKLGFESGQFFIPAILGFILTGVGLPLVGLMIDLCCQQRRKTFGRFHQAA